MGKVICEYRSNQTTPKGNDDREAARDDDCEGDECVRPGECPAGWREVLQTL
jgi:hypothetical protein